MIIKNWQDYITKAHLEQILNINDYDDVIRYFKVLGYKQTTTCTNTGVCIYIKQILRKQSSLVQIAYLTSDNTITVKFLKDNQHEK